MARNTEKNIKETGGVRLLIGLAAIMVVAATAAIIGYGTELKMNLKQKAK